MGTIQWNEASEMLSRAEIMRYALYMAVAIWDAREPLPPNLQPSRPLQAEGPISWGNKKCPISWARDICPTYWTSAQIKRHNCPNNIDFECWPYHAQPILKQVWIVWERLLKDLSNKPWHENLYNYYALISVPVHLYSNLMWLCKMFWRGLSWLVTKAPETERQKRYRVYAKAGGVKE